MGEKERGIVRESKEVVKDGEKDTCVCMYVCVCVCVHACMCVFTSELTCERGSDKIVFLFHSGRHKQEDSLFEEMLQVSQAIVSLLGTHFACTN